MFFDIFIFVNFPETNYKRYYHISKTQIYLVCNQISQFVTPLISQRITHILLWDNYRFTELRLASKLVTEATGTVVAVAKSSAVRAEGKLR